MAYRELELTLMSAQDLKNVNLITRMDVYAVVSISGDPMTRQCTEPDTYGGRNPCWDATFRFAVPPTAAAAAGASLQVLLRAERFLGDRDVGEVVVPLADILASATGAGAQPPQVASYQVRKLHRWEPRGVLNVSYRLGPVVAPVAQRAAPDKAADFNAYYAPVAAPPQPQPQSFHHYPSSVAYQAPPPPAPAPSRPAVRVADAEHDKAAQNKSPVMAYPVAVPQSQQASHLPAKPEAYRPSPLPSPRPPAVHAASRHEEARAPTPAPAPPPPAPTNTGRSNGLGGQSGPTHVYMGPHTQIIFSGGAPTTTTAGQPTWMTSHTGSIINPAGKKGGDGNNWALLPQDDQGSYYASAAESMSVSVISPRGRKEDGWRPNGLSQSQAQHDTQQQQQTASSPVAAPNHRLTASPFPSRSSSSSTPLSPYSLAHPSSSSSHSSNRSPCSSSGHHSAVTSPHPPASPLLPYSAHPSPSSAHSSNCSPYSSLGHPSTVTSPHPSASPLSPYSTHPSPSSAHSSNRSPYSSLGRTSTVTSPHPPASPLSPYSAHPSPTSAHSSTRSPYSSSGHPSTATSPRLPLRSPAANDATEVTHGNNNTFRSTSSHGAVVSSLSPSSSPVVNRSTSSHGATVSSPSPSSSPMVPNHSRRAAISSPLPSSTPLVPKHSSVVPY